MDSRSCAPTVRTGLRLVIGSWKIIAISLPRTRRHARSESPISSRPSSLMLPDGMRAARGRIPIAASAVTLLPQPDSPTSPSVSPARTSKLIPLTAWTIPRLVQKRTRRSSTARSGGS